MFNNIKWKIAELAGKMFDYIEGKLFMSEYHNMGYDAYWEGLDIEDNPFDPIDQSYAHLQWEIGWTSADDEIDFVDDRELF